MAKASLRSVTMVALSEMKDGQDGDIFALLSAKEELRTKDGKLYFKVGFRDAKREVKFPVWADSTWAVVCRDEWTVGQFYKIRGVYRDTPYGAQLEISKIRPVASSDESDGFDPLMLRPRSKFEPQSMFDELLSLAQQHIAPPVLELVLGLFHEHRQALLTWPAATRKHHAFLGGFLEHTLSVAKTAAYLSDHYAGLYDDMQPALRKDLVMAGAMLHDFGKLRELEERPEGSQYTPSGVLIGHVLQGRDMLREAAGKYTLDEETLLRLEHILVSHEPAPEWGAAKPPLTAEALLVRYAVEVDVRFQQFYQVLRDETVEGPLTSSKNVFQQRLFRGLTPTKHEKT